MSRKIQSQDIEPNEKCRKKSECKEMKKHERREK